MKQRALFTALVVMWAGAATFLALDRVPFDDEWYALSLTWRDDFAAMLAADKHPPWVAMFDRAVAGLWRERALLHATRVLATVASVVLLADVWRRGAGLSRLAVAAAAFHPLWIFYGGAARWYPFLLLGQALRAWAVWGAPERSRLASPSFIAGAFIGSAAGYIDALFLPLDAWWWHRRARPPWGLSALVAPLLLLALSPLPFSHPLHVVGDLPWSPWTLAGLSIAGEAHPPWPWLALALVPLAAQLRAHWLLHGKAAIFARWVLATSIAWLAATFFGVWHPRYALLAIALWNAPLFALWERERIDRVLAFGATAYLIVAGVFTFRRDGMLRADLQRFDSADCDVLRGSVIVSAYAGTRGQLREACMLSSEVFDDFDEARIERYLHTHREVLFVRRRWGAGDIVPLQERIAAALAQRCRRVEARALLRLPHPEVRSLFVPHAAETWLYEVERWRCAP